MSDERWPFPRSGPPLPVKDGIRARSRRGAFARNWWAARWLAVLEALQVGGRLSRGRSYARRGQVMDIAIGEGAVRARVQGSRPEPYEVAMRVTPLAPGAWQKLARVLADEAVFLAKLLAGEMPPDIEVAFGKAGLSLFPSRLSELQTSCSCPDWSNPCKHIAAVHYLLGEEFDRDPFLIFKLRGTTRDELLRLVEEVGEPRPRGGRLAKIPKPWSRRPRRRARRADFWRAGEIPNDLFREPVTPAEAGALLTRLGPFPFWRGKEPLAQALLAVYGRASAAALEVLAALAPPATDSRADR